MLVRRAVGVATAGAVAAARAGAAARGRTLGARGVASVALSYVEPGTASPALASLAKSAFATRKTRFAGAAELARAEAVAKELEAKEGALRAHLAADDAVSGPSEKTFALRREITALARELAATTPSPGPIAAHDVLDASRYAHIQATPLAGFHHGELARAVEDLTDAAVDVSDLFPVLADEIGYRLSEFQVDAIVRVAEAFHKHRHALRDGAFFRAAAAHLATRATELSAEDTVRALEVLVREGTECGALVTEATVHFAAWFEGPTKPDLDRRGEFFSRFVNAVAATGRAPSSFGAWVAYHVHLEPETFAENQFRNVVTFLRNVGLGSRDLDALVAREGRRREHEREAAALHEA